MTLAFLETCRVIFQENFLGPQGSVNKATLLNLKVHQFTVLRCPFSHGVVYQGQLLVAR